MSAIDTFIESRGKNWREEYVPDARMAREHGLSQSQWVQLWTRRICKDQMSPATARQEATCELREALLWPWE